MTACEMCGRTDKTLVVDHDHATGMIRGHVCKRCNLTLAVVEDPALISAAFAYLERTPSTVEYRTVHVDAVRARYHNDLAYRESVKARAKKWNRDNNYKHQRAAKLRAI